MLIGFDGAKIQQFPDILTVSVDFLMRRSVRAPLAAERLVPVLQVAPLTAERLVPVLPVAPLAAEGDRFHRPNV